MTHLTFQRISQDYLTRLKAAIDVIPEEPLERLAEALAAAWRSNRQVFLFGNGGSAGNAIHLANDYLYGVSGKLGNALRVTALPANSAVLTCLANDEGYDNVYVGQLAVLAQPGDLAIAFSGSGNSPNILKALEYCSANKIDSFAILGYAGGDAKLLANTVVHVPVDDMQISEDIQLIIGHLLMQWLRINQKNNLVDA